MLDGSKCPLCERAATSFVRDNARDMYVVVCERCGTFKISPTAMEDLTDEQKFGLSSVCRQSSSKKHPIEIVGSNIDELLKSLPHFGPSEKLDNFLQLICDMTPTLGTHSSFNSNRDYPLLGLSQRFTELSYLSEELKRRGYVELNAGQVSYLVTMKGWERLEEIRKQGRTSTRCFVAMWFDAAMTQIYEKGIEPAVKKAGNDPLRIDKFEHVNRIDDEIIGQIKRSRFMVADFTGQRHGVYFEAGMMLGLGRRVIWMCQKSEIEKSTLHFDVRQFNFIDYDTSSDARERLYHRILAVEGEGPLTIL
jgi:hypothetical protein